MDAAIYAGLALATALYAWALDWLGRKYGIRTRDWTWLEVVVGVGIVLLFLVGLNELHPEWTGSMYQRAAWLAFMAGGAPIIAWHNWRSRRDLQDTLDETIQNATRPSSEDDEEEGSDDAN